MRATRIGNYAKVGLARADMLIAVVSVTLLTAVWLPGLTAARVADHGIECRANLRRIMQSVHLYAGDNHGRLPYPSWGSVGSSGGPDNWAYASRIGTRAIPSAAGRLPHTNQVPFLEASQLWPYLRDSAVYRCPKDDAEVRQMGTAKRTWYIQRDLKLTSYAMNSAVISSGRLLSGQTHRLVAFRGDAVMFWETDESDPFYFNDAANRPNEGLSRRHGPGAEASYKSPTLDYRNGGNWVTLDGAARFVPARAFADLAGAVGRRPERLPNPLWCDPLDPVNGGW